MEYNWTDIVGSLSSAVSALAAITIPFVLAWWAHRQDRTRKQLSLETRTFRELDNINLRVAESVSQIMRICPDVGDLTYETISENKELEGHVFTLLNQYEYLCLGANKGLFASDVVEALRGNALARTRQQYHQYISTFRDRHDVDAWRQIDVLLQITS